MAVKHFADSLTVLKAIPNLATGATVADVGTGAGFPGLALKIARPDLQLLLLDSSAKRLTFLREVIDDLQLTGVSTLHSRAEEAGHLPTCRDRFDFVCARAVAALPTLLEWCGPLVACRRAVCRPESRWSGPRVVVRHPCRRAAQTVAGA